MAFAVKRPGQDRRGGRLALVILLLVAFLALAVGLYAWQQSRARAAAERQLGLDAARVLSERFSDQAAIKVATLSGDVVTRGQTESLGGLLRAEQTAKTPYSVDYFVDLRALGPGDYGWNPETRTITVVVPDVAPAAPNIDETRSDVDQSGLVITRNAGRELARQTSARAVQRVNVTARKPEHLDRARENARRVISGFATGPLAAAGLDEVRVAVRFPWEGRPGVGDGERWDESRRIEDVLKEPTPSQTKTS